MKIITIDDVGEVKLKKSPRAKRVILKIDGDGNAVVVLPRFAPYVVGERFAKTNTAWIIEHTTQQNKVHLSQGFKVGTKHTLQYQQSTTATAAKSRVQSNTIMVTLPAHMQISDAGAQQEAKRAVTRAIKREAEEVLPQMLYALSQQYNRPYTSVSVKNMRSRWGSCSSEGVIALNIWLMQVPDELKQYVLCHELAHLDNPHHQPAFWGTLAEMVPDYKAKRRALKQYQPNL